MVPNKRQCWLESFGSHPQRPPRLAGRTAAFATPPCSRQEAARWPPEPQPAADPWENLQAERKQVNILILKYYDFNSRKGEWPKKLLWWSCGVHC